MSKSEHFLVVSIRIMLITFCLIAASASVTFSLSIPVYVYHESASWRAEKLAFAEVKKQSLIDFGVVAND